MSSSRSILMTKLQGLTAATHTPFDADGELNLLVVEKQAELLVRDGVNAVFIAGSTGESHSLTIAERLALTQRWVEVAKGSPLRVVVHVGSNCLADSRTLAEQAQKLGVAAIAALAPSYFKPATLESLVECSRSIAAAALGVPFYFYDIPSMTGVRFSMPGYLELASTRIPTLTGLKYSNPDLMAYQRCCQVENGRFDIPWGIDEYLLAALAVGAIGGVGSSYNFATPIYQRMSVAFEKGDLAAARQEQFHCVQVIHLLGEFGYQAAARAVMEMRGVPVGPPRLPFASLATGRVEEVRESLTKLGFFEWMK